MGLAAISFHDRLDPLTADDEEFTYDRGPPSRKSCQIKLRSYAKILRVLRMPTPKLDEIRATYNKMGVTRTVKPALT